MLIKEKMKQNPFLKGETFEKGFFHSKGTYIDPTSIVGPNVELGENVKIGPFCLIIGRVKIDSQTRIHTNVSIGMPAQDRGTKDSLGTVKIGKNCEIREFVTISAAKKMNEHSPGNTIIGENCYLMNFSHVAHDVVLENNVTLINSVNLAGHVHVEHHSMLMANTAVHQFCRIGAYSALAPFSGMRQDLTPFSLFNGIPGRFAGLNIVALKRAGLESSDINGIKKVTQLFFQEKLPLAKIFHTVEQDALLKENKYVKHFLTFAKNSNRGISRKTIRE